MPHWKYKNKTKPLSGITLWRDHTKHPVRYFPGQNEMNREMGSIPGMDVCQSTNFKSLFISLFHLHHREDTTNTVSILSCQFVVNPSDESTWGNSEWGWSTWLQWIEWLAISALPGTNGVIHWYSLNLKIQNEAHEFDPHNSQTCWTVGGQVSGCWFVKGNI